ncbi:unnamed protein product [Durusdinium trenchii]|uniref:Potassium channel tetramerisation-type BTB domain-containing protein n=1 Tax=Durusdinium trenchii TaxID=1381693 RepID=A0ABP0NIX6_9DINO
MASGSDLVTFNVGGKIYQVLREPTLSLHPNSLLTQLAEDKQDDKEIFYVLAYHRDRKIILPPAVSMAAVQQELKRFGLDVKAEEIVPDEAYFPSMLKQIDKVVANQKKLLQDQQKQVVTFWQHGKNLLGDAGVLREPTLSLHPNSLLTQLAEDKQDDKEIFVEGDQDLFNYVLAYHRDRKIILPPNISAAAVQQELKRFGLDAKTEEMVRDGAYYPSMLKQIDQLVANQKNLLQKQQNQNAAAHLMSITAQALMEKSAKGNGEQISISFDEVVQNKFGSTSSEQRSFAFSCFKGFEQMHFKESMAAWAASIGYQATFWPHGTNPLRNKDSPMVSLTPVA